MKKQILALLLSFALVASGCSSAPAESETTDSTPSAPNESTSDSVMPSIAKEDLKVGVIHITDPAEGSGYTFAHDQGIIAMQETLGLSEDQIIRKINVPDADATATENAILECIEEGANVIYATSFNYMDQVEAIAAEYPDIYFSHGTGYKANGVNFNNYFGRIYQARYLSGIVAGLKTESDKIGYVGAWGSENGEVTSGCNAFAMGVNSVNPDAEIYFKSINAWVDAEGENQAAVALINEGCDVITQHSDTPNPQLAAEEAGVWGIGYNSDMQNDAPGAVLTSVIWNWDEYYTSATENILNGDWTGENYYGGLAEGFVDMTPLTDLVADGTAEKVEEARAKIISGEWDVFDGEIEGNDGEMHTSEHYSDINWYYKNVVVK